MTVLKLCMLALIGVAAAVIVKQWKADFVPLVRLCVVVLFGTAAIGIATPLINYLGSLMEVGGVSPYAAILFKALGIATLTQVCSEVCRESGEASAANGIELVGKIEILLLCLPLIEEILGAAKGLLTVGT